jgi:pyridoxal 5'-phosphate synthase pdxT subunit
MAATIGVLAVQGAFREHCRALSRCGAAVKEVRQCSDIAGIDALVIPGGESTAIAKLLIMLHMLEPLQQRIQQGMPVYGSCAGLILLCNSIEDAEGKPLPQARLGGIDATVRRNAFGRQVDSFETALPVQGIAQPVHAVFIRAPFIVRTGTGVQVLATVGGNAVAVQQGRLLATSFHPELTEDTSIHRYFLSLL